MEKFYSIIKIKENQMLDIQKKIHLKDMEIKECKEKALKKEHEIKELKNIQYDLEQPNLYSIIDNLKKEWICIENDMQSKITERNNIFAELMIKKQEIRSLEMLIEKKKIEMNVLLLKKEQEMLDEFNSLD